MVITEKKRKRERGSVLLSELIGAMLILTLAMVPIILMLAKDQQACRKYYFKAVADAKIIAEGKRDFVQTVLSLPIF